MTTVEQDLPDNAVESPTRPRWLVYVITIGLLVLAGVLGVRYWHFASTHVSTDDAALSTDVIQIAPQVSGTIQTVAVTDNQFVHAGDLLVALDDSTYRAAVAQAQANLEVAIAQAKGANVSTALIAQTGAAQIQQAQGAVDQASSGVTGAEADLARATAAIDAAQASARGATAGVDTAKAGLTTATANKERALQAVISAQAQIDSATANLAAAKAALGAVNLAADKAQKDSDRLQILLEKGAVSQRAADQGAVAASNARAQADAASEQVNAAQALLAARRADFNAAQQQVQVADAGIAQANAQCAAATEQVTAAQSNVRQVTAQQHTVAQSIRQAAAKRTQAIGQLSQAKTAPKQVEVSRTAQEQALAKIAQARAALQAAEIQLRNTRIVAPVDGIVSQKSAQTGALVQPGMPLLALVPKKAIWVTANFKETQLGSIRPGERAEVKVDALPGVTLHGTVDSIQVATGSVFALLPADNATGNFTKVVQRVPVKIMLDPGQSALDRLGAGMSVTAVITTR